jgi:hypothetical protein
MDPAAYAATRSPPSTTAVFKFLFPEKQSMSEAVHLARLPAADAESDQSAANKMRLCVARQCGIDKRSVKCGAFNMFMSNREQQIRCFCVRVEGEVPQLNNPVSIVLREMPFATLQNEVKKFTFLMVDPYLCALQILLNRCVCFPESAPVLSDRDGAAFIEIVKPTMFNQDANHQKSLFQVSIYVLRNIFAHFREEDFRQAVAEGSILHVTKLWLQEDCVEPYDSLNLGFWRSFDVAEYIFRGSHFAYVYSLSYRLIRLKLRCNDSLPPRYRAMLLQCMPAAHFDFEIPSELDW